MHNLEKLKELYNNPIIQKQWLAKMMWIHKQYLSNVVRWTKPFTDKMDRKIENLEINYPFDELDNWEIKVLITKK